MTTALKQAHSVPVTVVCGFYHASKAAAIAQILESDSKQRFAIIHAATSAIARETQDAADYATCVAARESPLEFLVAPLRSDARDGLRGDFHRALGGGEIDHVIVELRDCDTPDAAIATLSGGASAPTKNSPLWLYSVLTVVDTARFQDDYAKVALSGTHGNNRYVANVLAGQVELADRVLLCHAADIPPQLVQEVRDIVRVLNPETQWHQTHDNINDTADMVATSTHDRERDDLRPGWLRADAAGMPLPPTAAYQVTRVTYDRRRPFHPDRLDAFLNGTWPWLLRGRGQFWLASQPDWAYDFEQAGCAVNIRPFGYWWASDVVGGRDDAPPDLRAELDALWHSVYGDRRQRLVLMGIDIDGERLQRELDDCLVTDAEMAGGLAALRQWPDPWPAPAPEAATADAPSRGIDTLRVIEASYGTT